MSRLHRAVWDTWAGERLLQHTWTVTLSVAVLPEFLKATANSRKHLHSITVTLPEHQTDDWAKEIFSLGLHIIQNKGCLFGPKEQKMTIHGSRLYMRPCFGCLSSGSVEPQPGTGQCTEWGKKFWCKVSQVEYSVWNWCERLMVRAQGHVCVCGETGGIWRSPQTRIMER